MVKVWDVENEVDEIFYTLRKRYEKECLNDSSNKFGVRKKVLKLKDQFEKTCPFFQEIFGLIGIINL